jgi:hypothetical protein
MSPEQEDAMDATGAALTRLSPAERDAIGGLDDFAWDEAITLPARSRPEMAQFSVRVERDLVEGLQAIAEHQGATFSDVVRYALRSFVTSGAAPRGISNVFITSGPTRGPLYLDVQGQRTELGASRRMVGPNERVRVVVAEEAVTAARV